MRALPGTGKSTKAKAIEEAMFVAGFQAVICSTDDYFTDEDGNYNWSAKLVGSAHRWNKERAYEYMSNGVHVVIIDNTNIQYWEAEEYINTGIKFGYTVEVVYPDTPWSGNIEELVNRNVHGVPREAIERMAKNWEDDFSFMKKLAQALDKA